MEDVSQPQVIAFLMNARKKIEENAYDAELMMHYDSVLEDLRIFDY